MQYSVGNWESLKSFLPFVFCNIFSIKLCAILPIKTNQETEVNP